LIDHDGKIGSKIDARRVVHCVGKYIKLLNFFRSLERLFKATIRKTDSYPNGE
jgi:hypothetical protein